MRYSVPVLLPLILTTCTAEGYREEADEQVYGILETAAVHVTGQAKTYNIDRPEDTLRRAMEDDPTLQVELDLAAALDVAAQNSRAFQTRKEALYQAGLRLTLEQNNFSLLYSGGNQEVVSGVGQQEGTLSIRNDLFASRNTTAGGRVVAGFVNSFLKDFIHGGSFNGSSILNFSFTQPLLRGFGSRIAREPLTQAERNVIYEMRTFERFRETFAVQVATSYLRLLEDTQNLQNVQANLDATRRNRERVEGMVEANRLAAVDLDRARQSEFTAQDQVNIAIANLATSFDQFKLLLGLPTDCTITLDPQGLDKLRGLAVELVNLDEERAVELALQRRYDYRTVVDNVEDASRKVIIAENALQSILDFSSAISIPTDPRNPVQFDWSRVDWSAGFNLDLALNRLPERNAYRTSLITLAVDIRNREQLADEIKAQVRVALRTIRRTYVSYQIQVQSTRQAVVRNERALLFLEAGRGRTLDLLDAQQDLLGNQLALTGSIVNYAVSRLQLLRDLEGLVLEPKGLRYDPGLPLPQRPLSGSAGSGEAGGPAVPTTEEDAADDDQGGSE